MAYPRDLMVLILFGLVAQVSALPSLTTPSSIHRLFSRQGSSGIDPSTLPPQCLSQGCSAIVSSLDACEQPSSSATCICTAEDEVNFGSCLNCLISVSPEILQEEQDFFDQYVSDCRSAGVPLASSTLRGIGAISSTPLRASSSVEVFNTITNTARTTISALDGPSTTTGGPGTGNSNAPGSGNGALSFASVNWLRIISACIGVTAGVAFGY